jgi:mono/diheme cytochrome c family protein
VTEIPPHLLDRSRARRAALGLGGAEGAAPVAAAATSDAPVKAASSSPAAASKAAASKVAAPVVPERVLPPYALAEETRKKIPMWAVPVLLLLPIWGFLYVGTLEKGPVVATGVLAEGATTYATSCAGCHGATGGGGTGPAMAGGAVLATWPEWQNHVAWVVHGSSEVKGQPYGATGKIASGNMPAFGATLTPKQLLSAVYYERVTFGGQPETDLTVLHALAESTTLTAAQLQAALSAKDIDALATELGIAAAASGSAAGR